LRYLPVRQVTKGHVVPSEWTLVNTRLDSTSPRSVPNTASRDGYQFYRLGQWRRRYRPGADVATRCGTGSDQKRLDASTPFASATRPNSRSRAPRAARRTSLPRPHESALGPLYDEVLFRAKSMITVLQRVCWNVSGWKAPSGEAFDGGNPGKHGFGNEEWNFCTEDALDGYVFGYLYWQPARRLCHEHFQIGFWTIPPVRKVKLLVGFYHDATLATKDELRALDAFFLKGGVYERRLAEAVKAVEQPEQKAYVRRHPPSRARLLRFKCPVEKVEFLHPERVLPKVFQGRTIGAHFTRPTILKKRIDASDLAAAGRRRSRLGFLPSPLLEDVYPRATPSSLRLIYPRHKELSNQFVGWLGRTGRTVSGREKDRVDVEFRDGSDFCRAELKICYGMTTTQAIREAMGQLLEYNYYGWRTPADRWFVVLDIAPAPADIQYLRKLAREKLLPLTLSWRSGNQFELVSLCTSS
jgi:hypothetical protein